MTLVLAPRPELIPGFADSPEQRWQPWGGDPAPLAGDSPLIKEANALQAIYASRAANLALAQRAPDDATEAIIKLHQSYLAELERAANNGEPSTVAADLKRKRDETEAAAKGADFEAIINAATVAVENARECYKAFLEDHWTELLDEIRPAAIEVVREHAKITAEAEQRLAGVHTQWALIHETSRQIVGNLDGLFRRSDLPELGDYSKLPLPPRVQ
jgi:hypothetical protein